MIIPKEQGCIWQNDAIVHIQFEYATLSGPILRNRSYSPRADKVRKPIHKIQHWPSHLRCTQNSFTDQSDFIRQTGTWPSSPHCMLVLTHSRKTLTGHTSESCSDDKSIHFFPHSFYSSPPINIKFPLIWLHPIYALIYL